MTFKEYINMNDAKRRHYYVTVTKEDCELVYNNGAPGQRHVVLDVLGEKFTYLLTRESTSLFTMDEDGNRSGTSCFSWEGE